MHVTLLPWVPLCEQHPHERLSQPRQFCDDLKFILAESRHNFSSATNNKRLLFELVKSNLIHNNGPFLDTGLINIFVKERLTFATSHSKVWLPVLTHSLSNM